MERSLTSEQVAESLRVGAATVRKYARAGVIPFSTTPGGHRRYALDEVRRALRARFPSTGPAAQPEPPVMLSGAEYDDIGRVSPRRVIRAEVVVNKVSHPGVRLGLDAHELGSLLAGDGLG